MRAGRVGGAHAREGGPGHAVKVKVCGITRPEDAREAAEAGADFLGAVLIPSSKRHVDPATARAFRTAGGPPLVVVVDAADPVETGEEARLAKADVIQLHGSETPRSVGVLRRMGDWKIWKALRVRDPGGLAEAVAPWLGLVDGLLLDGWHPDLPGGAGVRFDWNRAAAFRSNLPGDLLFVAAGGLTPENVTEVLPLLRPDVVDVSSGVETAPGIKDARAVRAFIQAVRSAPGPSDP